MRFVTVVTQGSVLRIGFVVCTKAVRFINTKYARDQAFVIESYDVEIASRSALLIDSLLCIAFRSLITLAACSVRIRPGNKP